jgi:acyl carrier protein
MNPGISVPANDLWRVRVITQHRSWFFMPATTQNGQLELIVEEFRTVFKNKGLVAPAMSPATVLDGSLGLESLDFAEVVMRLEQVFGTDPFGGDTIPEVNTLADLCALYPDSKP